MKKNNAIVIHGGGLVDPSKYVLMKFAQLMSRGIIYDAVYVGHYSFESLYTPKMMRRYDQTLVDEVKGKRGTCFGTSRGIDLTDPALAEKAITCLRERKIRTVVVVGGDGSSRQVAEISEKFMENGINFIFPLPLTIDGINGGDSIGIKEAVKESVRQIENICSTSLETRDKGEFGVVMVELQGRNRDDIIARTLNYFSTNKKVADCNMSDILLRVVPANFDTNEKKLVDEINNSKKRTLILVSEGAQIKIPELTKKINRKVRSLVVGHPSQSNGLTSDKSIREYHEWINKIYYEIIVKDPHGSYCVARNKKTLSVEPIDYYAKLNPRNGQRAELNTQLKKLIKAYMA